LWKGKVLQDILFFLLFVALAVWMLNSPWLALISLLVGLILLVRGFYFVFIMTPRTVELFEDVILFTSYANTKRTYRIEEIAYIVIIASPPKWSKKFDVGNVGIWNVWHMFYFTREICEAIRTAYFEKMGKYPPTYA
jgi:hypothetical protein